MDDNDLFVLLLCCAGVLALACLAAVFYYLCRKRQEKEQQIRVQRVQSRLDELAVRDPLEEIVRRESRRLVPGSTLGVKANYATIQGQGYSKVLYKIWNSSRTNRQVALAASMEELLSKARVKLSLTHGPLRVVLEEDGTQIDSDQELLACWGHVCLILEQGQSWTPPPFRAPPPTTAHFRLPDAGSFGSAPLGHAHHPAPPALVPRLSTAASRRDSGLGLMSSPLGCYDNPLTPEMTELEAPEEEEIKHG